MAKWEAIDRNGETHAGNGKEQLQALLQAGTLAEGDGLHDEAKKKWTTVGQYLAAPAGRAAAAAPARSAAAALPAIDRALDRRQMILFAVIGGVVLLAVVIFAFRDSLLPSAPPVATPTGIMPAATAPAAAGEGQTGNAGGERLAAVAVGEEYNVLIESVGGRGDGLTHVGGMVVFVPGTREGEKLRVRITEVKSTTAQAEKIGPATGPVETAAARPAAGDSPAPAGSGDSSRPAPVEVGREYQVTIEEVGSRGDGLTHIEGMVVFVPGTQKGQQVKIRITELKRSSAVGEVVR